MSEGKSKLLVVFSQEDPYHPLTFRLYMVVTCMDCVLRLCLWNMIGVFRGDCAQLSYAGSFSELQEGLFQ